VRRDRGDAFGADFGRHRLDHFEVEVGGFEGKARAFGPDQHIGQDRNGIPPLDHAVHMRQRFQELGALHGDFHNEPRSVGWEASAREEERRIVLVPPP